MRDFHSANRGDSELLVCGDYAPLFFLVPRIVRVEQVGDALEVWEGLRKKLEALAGELRGNRSQTSHVRTRSRERLHKPGVGAGGVAASRHDDRNRAGLFLH